jgi:hypothetical protein
MSNQIFVSTHCYLFSVSKTITETICMKLRFFLFFGMSCLVYFILYRQVMLVWPFQQTPIDIYNYMNGSAWTVKSVMGRSIVSSIRHKTGRRVAVFACSIHSSTTAYIFYTPLSAAAWQRIGYDVITLFVGDFRLVELQSSLYITQQLLQQMGVLVLNVQCNASYATKISQLIRVFIGFLPSSFVGDEDGLITTDSDLIPLDYRQYEPSTNNDGFLINSYCCGLFNRRGKEYRMLPMSYIYLSKRTWQALLIESVHRSELLSLNVSLSLLSPETSLSSSMVSLYARHEFKHVFDQDMIKGDDAWYMDQILCSMLLTDYRQNHPNLRLSERNLTERLDRKFGILSWNRSSFEQFGDAHLPHDDIFEPSNWEILNKLLRFLFTDSQVDMLNQYYKQYSNLNKNVL